MKKKLFFKLSYLSFISLFLFGCSNVPDPNLEDYIVTMDWQENFTICTLNDIHLSVQSNLKEEFEYLENVIYSRAYLNDDAANKMDYAPDLVVINGDTFMTANKYVVKEFFKFMDSLKIPYAYTYGNHDFQGQYSKTFLMDQISSAKYCIVKNPKDNVFGDSNYVVNIKSGSFLKWQLYFFDSNTYNGFGYDRIHDDQVDWYEKQVKLANKEVSKIIPSMSFFHIPTEEFNEAWKSIGNKTRFGKDDTTGSIWHMEEKVSCSGLKSNLYEKMQELRSTVSMIVAHDHINFTDWHYDKNNNGHDIRLIFGIKTGRGIYHNPNLMGCVFYTLSDGNNTFDLLRVNAKYDGTYRIITDEMLLGGSK